MVMAKAAGTLRIGGLTHLSTVDYPGLLSAVVFCQGCPWRCAYCHNTHLQSPRASSPWDWGRVLAFLQRRRGLLDAVVFSGGEPTLQGGLADALRIVRQMGYRVGLHTAGVAPKRLEMLIPHCDWIAMDIKAPFDDYALTTARRASGGSAWASLKLILDSGVDHEFRTTVHPGLLVPQALLRLAAGLAERGRSSLCVAGIPGAGLLKRGDAWGDVLSRPMLSYRP